MSLERVRTLLGKFGLTKSSDELAIQIISLGPYIFFTDASGDNFLIVTGDTSMQAEVYALHSLLIWLDSPKMFKQNNRLVILTDCLTMLAQLSGTVRVTGRPFLKVYQNLFKYVDQISKRTGFDVWSILQFRWITGSEMKRTILCH